MVFYYSMNAGIGGDIQTLAFATFCSYKWMDTKTSTKSHLVNILAQLVQLEISNLEKTQLSK